MDEIQPENKETQDDRITSLLGLDKESIHYDSDLSMFKKRLASIKKYLKIEVDEHGELILLFLNSKGFNLTSLTAKKREKQDFETDLYHVLQMQKDFYNSEIYPLVLNAAYKSCRSNSDVDVVLNEKAYQYSIPIADKVTVLSEMDSVMNYINMKTSELNQYIDSTFRLVFVDYFETPVGFMNVPQFGVIVEEAIEKYNRVKANKYNRDNHQQMNPYVRLYQLMRAKYIRNHFDLQLPDTKYFTDCRFDKVSFETKRLYGLKDVAVVLTQLIMGVDPSSETEIDRKYSILKKCFNENKLLQNYKKKNGVYMFPEVYTPLSYYLFYRKKNNQSIKEAGIAEVNRFILYRIQPILQSILTGENDKLKSAFAYIDFIRSEFTSIMSEFDHGYQLTMLDYWFETIVNIYYRTKGLKSESVYCRYPAGNILD
jgi:hypothetical protein